MKNGVRSRETGVRRMKNGGESPNTEAMRMKNEKIQTLPANFLFKWDSTLVY